MENSRKYLLLILIFFSIGCVRSQVEDINKYWTPSTNLSAYFEVEPIVEQKLSKDSTIIYETISAPNINDDSEMGHLIIYGDFDHQEEMEILQKTLSDNDSLNGFQELVAQDIDFKVNVGNILLNKKEYCGLVVYSWSNKGYPYRTLLDSVDVHPRPILFTIDVKFENGERQDWFVDIDQGDKLFRKKLDNDQSSVEMKIFEMCPYTLCVGADGYICKVLRIDPQGIMTDYGYYGYTIPFSVTLTAISEGSHATSCSEQIPKAELRYDANSNILDWSEN